MSFKYLLKNDKPNKIHHQNIRRVLTEIHRISHNIPECAFKEVFESREQYLSLQTILNF